jgi:beta-lactamase class A
MFDALVQPLIAKFSGQVSIAYYNFGNRQSYAHNIAQQMRSASLIKLPILLCALNHSIPLSQRFKVTDDDMVIGAGVLQALNPGLEPTWHDLLTLMIIVSDNTATNLVIDILGQDTINRYIQSLGLSHTGLIGKLQLPEHKQNPEQKKGRRNHTSALDVLSLLVRLEQRQLLSEASTRIALEILKKQHFTEALSRYLPRDPEIYDDYIVVASKSGSLKGLWHDAAIVYNKAHEPLYALVVMTDGSADESYSWDQEGMMLIANISKLLFQGKTSVSP